MVETKPSDEGERLNRHRAEKPALDSPEGQQVRNATGDQVEAVRAANPDRCDGSATPKNRAGITDQQHLLIDKQAGSFELTDRDESGLETIVAARGLQAKSSTEAQKIAYDLKEFARDWNNGAKKAGTFVDRTKEQIGKSELRQMEAPASLDVLHPHAGKEDDYVSYGSCRAANMRFPEISKRLGSGPGKIDPDLIAAVIRHEQEAYKQLYDSGQDNYVSKHGSAAGLSEDVSIGPAQIQIRNINKLVKEFPEQLGHYAKDPLRAAQNPGDAPFFVAGYFTDVIQHLNKGTKPEFTGTLDWANVRKLWFEGDLNGALIKSYNPHPKQIEFVMKNLKLIQEKGLR